MNKGIVLACAHRLNEIKSHLSLINQMDESIPSYQCCIMQLKEFMYLMFCYFLIKKFIQLGL